MNLALAREWPANPELGSVFHLGSGDSGRAREGQRRGLCPAAAGKPPHFFALSIVKYFCPVLSLIFVAIRLAKQSLLKLVVHSAHGTRMLNCSTSLLFSFSWAPLLREQQLLHIPGTFRAGGCLLSDTNDSACLEGKRMLDNIHHYLGRWWKPSCANLITLKNTGSSDQCFFWTCTFK